MRKYARDQGGKGGDKGHTVPYFPYFLERAKGSLFVLYRLYSNPNPTRVRQGRPAARANARRGSAHGAGGTP